MRTKNKHLEKQVKKRIWDRLMKGYEGGKHFEIWIVDGKNVVFEYKDMVDAIYKVGKRK